MPFCIVQIVLTVAGEKHDSNRPAKSPRSLNEDDFGSSFQAAKDAVTVTFRPGRLEFFVPLAGRHFKRILPARAARTSFRFLYFAWIDARRQLLTNEIPALPGFGERYVRVDAEREAPFLAIEAVFRALSVAPTG